MTTADINRITLNLKHLRNYFGYTQDQVAEKLHLTRTSYCQYELGNKIMTVDTVFNLANVYNISPSTVIEQNESIFLHELHSCHPIKDSSVHLTEIFAKLDAFDQGRLIERAEELLENETKRNK